jgi:hypothetical protein
MSSTYEPIATTTLGTGTSTVTFSSIPQTYTDLVIIVSARANTGSRTEFQFTTNLTGSIYSSTFFNGYGSGVSSFRDTANTYARPGFLSGSTDGYSINKFSIMNYANTTTRKTMVGTYANAQNEVVGFVTLIANTGAINQISFYSASGGFGTNSMFTIYGIKAE